MWRYTAVKPYTITRDIFLQAVADVQQPPIPITVTDEAIDFLNQLYQPFLTALTNIHRTDHLRQYAACFGNIKLPDNGDLTSLTHQLLQLLIRFITWDNEAGECGITRNTSIINPWIIKDYIHNHKNTMCLFHLTPPHHNNYTGKDYETTPVKLRVFICGIGVYDIEYEVLLGFMAVSRHLHIMHPFIYNSHIFTEEMEEVNRRAFDNHLHKYIVNIGTDVYSFSVLDFVRGMIMGTKYYNINTSIIPHLREKSKNNTIFIDLSQD